MNVKATLDFCKMVIEYMELDCEITPLEGYAINYGEITEWVKKYPDLCEDFMNGDSKLSEVADELAYAMYKFASMVK